MSNVFKYLLPSQRHRHQVREFLDNPSAFLERADRSKALLTMRSVLLKTKGSYREYMDKVFEKEGLVRDGRFIGKQAEKASWELPRSSSRRIMRLDASDLEPYGVTTFNRLYLKRFLDLTEQAGIRVYICHPPILEQRYYNPEENAKISSYLEFIRKLARENTHVEMLTDDLHVVTPSQVHDKPNHLNEKSALNFSQRIAREISRRQASALEAGPR